MIETITWFPLKTFNNPETSGTYLVTTKKTGAVTMRVYDGSTDRWAFGEPLAWAYPPEGYKEV